MASEDATMPPAPSANIEVKLPIYAGNTACTATSLGVEEWISHANSYQLFAKLDDAQMAERVNTAFTNEAQTWFYLARRIEEQWVKSWAQIKIQVRKRFGQIETEDQMLDSLAELRQGHLRTDETPYQFYDRCVAHAAQEMEAIMRQVGPDTDVSAQNCQTLKTEVLKRTIRSTFIHGLHQAVKDRARFDAQAPLEKIKTQAQTAANELRNSRKAVNEVKSDEIEETSDSIERINFRRSRFNARQNGNFNKNKFADVTCQVCQKTGHTAKTCPMVSKTGDKKPAVCQYCNRRGHTAKDCFRLKDKMVEKKQ